MFCTKEDPPTHTPREGWWPNIYDKFLFLNGYLPQYLGQRERERERKEGREKEREEVRKKAKKRKVVVSKKQINNICCGNMDELNPCQLIHFRKTLFSCLVCDKVIFEEVQRS